MKKTVLRCLLALGSLAMFFVLAEALYRWVGPDEITGANLHARYRTYFEDAERNEIGYVEARERGMVVAEPHMPKHRYRDVWAPNTTFYLCYSDGHQPYFDARGCVPCVINSRQIREREELCEPKPEGQRRVVCIGDSFTFGWGVRVEDAWPRRVEAVLRRTDDDIRTVNCGASGTMFVDEYWIALRERFVAFEPDGVLVTLCLNDLLPTLTALSHQEVRELPWPFRHSRIVRDLSSGYALERSLRIDPDRDLVQELIDLDQEVYRYITWLGDPESGLLVGREDLWPGGGPQGSLRTMRDWCHARGIDLGVVIWPYLQGLGPGEDYPFRKIHDLVREFCAAEGIPFLDVLPALEGKHATPDLWVNPADYHGNALAHELATPAIAAFVAELLARGG